MPSHQPDTVNEMHHGHLRCPSWCRRREFDHSLLLLFVLLLLLEFGVNDRLVLLYLALPCSNKIEKECEGDLG